MARGHICLLIALILLLVRRILKLLGGRGLELLITARLSVGEPLLLLGRTLEGLCLHALLLKQKLAFLLLFLPLLLLLEDEALLLVDFVEVEGRHDKFLHRGCELEAEALRHRALVR